MKKEMNSLNRRELLSMAGMAALGGLATNASAQAGGKPSGLRLFEVTNYGAVADGKTLDSAAINRAIDACQAGGGGLVYVPPGIYLCGMVVLKSNVTLYLEAGATLLGSKNLADYAPPPGSAAKNNHLIFAGNAENVGLAGPGRIDGQGPSFWHSNGRKPFPESEGFLDTATWYLAPRPRPSPLLEFYNCKHLRIEDVRIENAPGWTLRPIECENVIIRGIAIKNPRTGPNTDGIDPTCCQNVFIADCLIDTGDDALCLKSESPYGGEPGVSRNITITNCVLNSCCNGLKFGTATRGGFENIVFSNSVIFSNDVKLSERVISGIAVEMVDGGWLEGVVISNIRMQRVRTPIFIRRGNRHPRPDGTPGILRGVMIENVHATDSILTSSITGQPGFDVEDVTLSNIHIESAEAGQAAWVNRDIPEAAKDYPEARMFGRLPAFGLYCRHVKGLRLRQIEFTASNSEERPAIVCDDAKDLEITGLRSAVVQGTQPTVKLIQPSQALLNNCVAPQGSKAFLEVQGGQTKDVVVMNCDLTGAEKPLQSGAEVSAKAILLSGNASRRI
jgi:polygalacturonase